MADQGDELTFLDEQIGFTDIGRVVEATMDQLPAEPVPTKG